MASTSNSFVPEICIYSLARVFVQDSGQASTASATAPAQPAHGNEVVQSNSNGNGAKPAAESNSPAGAPEPDIDATSLRDDVVAPASDVPQPEQHPAAATHGPNEYDIKAAEVRISVAEANAEMHRKEKEALVNQLSALNQQVQLLQAERQPTGPSIESKGANDGKDMGDSDRATAGRGSRRSKAKVC